MDSKMYNSTVALSDDNTVTIRNSEWSSHVLDTLNNMRYNNHFCDVALEIHEANNTKYIFNAHACVLASSSDLMQTILDPQPKRRCIFLKSLNRKVLALCLNYIYGCEVVLNNDNVRELSSAAEILQISSLSGHCKHALEMIERVQCELTISSALHIVEPTYEPMECGDVEDNKCEVIFEEIDESGSTALQPVEYIEQPTATDTQSFDAVKQSACADTQPNDDINVQPMVVVKLSNDIEQRSCSNNQSYDDSTPPSCAATQSCKNLPFNTSVADIIKQLVNAKDNKHKDIKFIVVDPALAKQSKKKGKNLRSLISRYNSSMDGRTKVAKRSQSNFASYQSTVRRELCDHCGRTFCGLRGLREHRERVAQALIRNVEREAMKNDPNVEYLCNICGAVIKGRKPIMNHKANHIRRRNGVRKKCEHCGGYFAGDKGLREHMERVNKNPNFKIFSFDKNEQKRKKVAARAAQRQCEQCGKQFKNWNSYYRHKKIEHDRTFVCQFCNKVFLAATYLKLHEQRHTKEKNFYCSYCDFGAVSKFEIQDHMDRHHSDEEFICTQCPSVFKSKLYLQRHEREYHRKGLRDCAHCDYRGIERNLKNHMRNQHFPHLRKAWCCDICGKEFTMKGHHDRHLVQVHQTAPTRLVPFSVNRAIEVEAPVTSSAPIAAVPRRRTPTTQNKKRKQPQVVEEYQTEEFVITTSHDASMYPLQHDIVGQVTDIADQSFLFSSIHPK